MICLISILLLVMTPTLILARATISPSGGYQGVLVVLDPVLEEDPELVEQLKELFNLTSQALHTATR